MLLGSLLSKDLAIDMGTMNTVIFAKGRGIVLREPSVVALKNMPRREVVAAGESARELVGRTPGNITAIYPIKDGAIADFELTGTMLKYFISKASAVRALKTSPRIVICVPGELTGMERKAMEEAARMAGARDVQLIDKALAAAYGAGISTDVPRGNMVIDFGAGTTEIAVISMGGLVLCRSLKIAGNHLRDAITDFVRTEYGVAIGEYAAENLKCEMGEALLGVENGTQSIRGRSMASGLPQMVTISAGEIYNAMHEKLSAIVAAVKSVLEQPPPELAGDILESGITLTGGGALLDGIDLLLEKETGIPVHAAASPIDCAAYGAGIAMETYGYAAVPQAISKSQ
jgi:rod shape-determining protein MreB